MTSTTRSTRSLSTGRPLHYLASAGHLVLRDDDGKPMASMFFVAYTRSGRRGRRRPSIRPGRSRSASTAGPGRRRSGCTSGRSARRRVRLPDDGEPPTPPYSLVDNEIHPAGSDRPGVHRPGVDRLQPAGARRGPETVPRRQEDIQSVGDFIRLYTTRYGRWRSPKFLAGESYGTTRAAGLAGYLQDRHGMYLNGIVLVSSVLNFETIRFDEGNDLPFALFLPTYTATAWYHKKLPADLQSATLANVVGRGRAVRRHGIHARPDGRRQAAGREEAGHRPEARPVHRPVGGFRPPGEPADRDSAVLQGVAARPATDRRPVRQPVRGQRPRRRRRAAGVRPELRRGAGGVHRARSTNTCAADLQVRDRPDVRDPDRQGAAVGLRHGQEPLPQRRPRRCGRR